MKTDDRIVNEISALLERETSVNLHRFPLFLELADGILTISGEVEHIMAKKRALADGGIDGIIHRMDRWGI